MQSIHSRTLLCVALAGILAIGAADAITVPDTGQDICFNATTSDSVAAGTALSVAREGGPFPRQDCRYGADPAATAGTLVKVGAGPKGFDYTKIAMNGQVLPPAAALGTSPTDWACTRDNNTGLLWEVKSPDNLSYRYYGHRYQWFSNIPATNGGNAGGTGSTLVACNSTLSACTTQEFIKAVQFNGLCGVFDWRMPSGREIVTILHLGATPFWEATYFPNASTESYWTGTTFPAGVSGAFAMDANLRELSGYDKLNYQPLRAVRGPAF